MKLIDKVLLTVRLEGMRLTRPRKLVLEALSKAKRPLSVLEVQHACAEPVDVVTIYRIMETFEEMGFIRSSHFGERHALFELVDVEEHKHLIRCTMCGRTDPIDVCVLEEAERVTDYEISGHSVEFVGVCPRCQKKRQPAEVAA